MDIGGSEFAPSLPLACGLGKYNYLRLLSYMTKVPERSPIQA